MDKITSEDIKVYGRLVSVSTENKLADAEQIWDSNIRKNQQELNQEFRTYIQTIRNLDSKINNAFLGDIHIGGDLVVDGSITSCPATTDVYGMVKVANGLTDEDESKAITIGTISPLVNRSENNSNYIRILQSRVALLEAKVANLENTLAAQ